MEYARTPILIIGTGAEARIALDIANALDVVVYGFLTEEPEEVHQELNDILIVSELGGADAEKLFQDEHTKLVLAVREISKRTELVEELSSKVADMVTLAHPTALISPYAKLGEGCLIYPYVTILANSLIGSFTLIMAGANIGADVDLGEYVTVSQGAQIGNGAVIGDECFIGAGAIVQPGVTVGRESLIGAGAVVLKDVPENATVFGNPGKQLGQ